MRVLFVAGKLYLSEHTVRHHLEHSCDKIGVHTRVAATLFAVEHDLLHEPVVPPCSLRPISRHSRMDLPV
jgi:hypothetical protein